MNFKVLLRFKSILPKRIILLGGILYVLSTYCFAQTDSVALSYKHQQTISLDSLDFESYCKASSRLVRHYCEQKQYSQSISEGETSLLKTAEWRIPSNLREGARLAWIHVMLGETYQELSHYAAAESAIRNAISILERWSYPKEIVLAENLYLPIANIYNRLDEHALCEQYLNKVLAIAEKKKDLDLLSRYYQDYAIVKGVQVDYEAAKHAYQEGLAIEADSISVETRISLSQGIAEIYFIESNWQKGLEHLTNAQSLILQIEGNEVREFQSYQHLSWATYYDSIGNSEKTIVEFRKSIYELIGYFDGQRNHREVSKLEVDFGQYFLKIGEFDSAQNHFLLAIQGLDTGFMDKDLESFDDSYLFITDNSLMEAFDGLSDSYYYSLNPEDLQKALNSGLYAIQLRTQLREYHFYQSSKFTQQEEDHARVSHLLNILWKRDSLGQSPNTNSEVLQLMEHVRANVLQENIRQRLNSLNHLTPAAYLLLKTSKENRLFKRTALEKNQKDSLVRKLSQDLFEADQIHKRILDSLSNIYPDLKSISVKGDFSKELIQEKLDPQSLLWSCHYGKRWLHIIWIDSDSTHWERIEISTFEPELKELMDFLRQDQASQADLFKFINLSNVLFKKLHFDRLPIKEKVYLLKDGYLQSLPFEILLTHKIERDKTGAINNFQDEWRMLPYWLRQTAFHNLFALQLWLDEEAFVGLPQDQFAGFAPEYEDNLSLKYNLQEAQSASANWQGKAFLGPAANKERFLEIAPSLSHIHLATHAFLDSIDFEKAYFLLGRSDKVENRLYAFEIADLDLLTELVVLSSCNTAAGKYIAGEGVLSLGWAFRSAGAKYILMSNWLTDGASSSRLLDLFYENVLSGEPYEKALQKAQTKFLQTAPPEELHPYYWANFQFFGEASYPKLQYNWYLISTGLLLLASVVLFRKKLISSHVKRT
ncbi:MAG: CHAT domain-containing tetratricopeptide repeat protein [Bacteroidota bacterium]